MYIDVPKLLEPKKRKFAPFSISSFLRTLSLINVIPIKRVPRNPRKNGFFSNLGVESHPKAFLSA